jgi:hypothetical protein
MPRKTPKPQNSSGTARKPPGRPFVKGKSGNPGGRPKNEKSISYWLKHFGNLTPALAAKELEGVIAGLKQQPADMPWFKLVALRSLQAMVNEPDSRMLREVMDRTEGRVPVTVVTWEDEYVRALKGHEVTPEWVRDELGDELAQQLFRAAGVTLASN